MRIVYLFIILGVALVFYLSWVPSPIMRFVWFLPDWVARWADVKQNEDLRTAVPFVFLGFLTGTWLAYSRYSWSWWLVAALGLTAIAAIAEVGQLALPLRNFSVLDIMWGGIGSVVGLLTMAVVVFISRQIKFGFKQS
ncbi:hypothetical protein [Larkinella terrae]|uniref:VanZ family protein n=1 Tax=Larkinella terrae TaxID=2025311 RepID=A0A7K0ELI0_9BACT|nr:hypothetical protein [Larkinella terrae]MRS62356.1 hypothetical protein [Larkinella terrae]